MKEIIYKNFIVTLDGNEYTIQELSKNDEFVVTIYLVNGDVGFLYAVKAMEVAINGIIQTSADMIIETLSNG